MVAQLVPERDFRGPGCSDRCTTLRALIPGVFGRSEVLIHDAESHEEYGRSLCSHGGGQEPDMVVTGPLAIDLKRMAVTLDGRRLDMTPTELKVLRALARRPGTVVETRAVLEEVWGAGFLVGTYGQNLHLLRANIWRVRKKLRRAGSLLTVSPAIGYCLDMIEAGADPPPPQHHLRYGFQPIATWAMEFDRCQRCGHDDRPHEGRGLCRVCYSRAKERGEFGSKARAVGASS